MTTRYQSQRRRKLDNQNRIGYMLIIVVIIIIVVIGYYFIDSILTNNYQKIDEITLCPVNGPTSLTIIVIDRSESLKPVQQELLRKNLIEIKEAVPRFGSLEVYTVGQTDKAVLRPEIKICNPGRAQDVSKLTANPQRLEKKWRTQFSQSLDDIFSRLVVVTNDQFSPIMETIQSVAATSLAGSHNKDLPIKLIIVSDFIQHTQQYSQYKGVDTFDKFKNNPYFKQLHTDLNGADVEMFYLLRDSSQKVQSPEHTKFWRDYFSAHHGTVVHYLPI